MASEHMPPAPLPSVEAAFAGADDLEDAEPPRLPAPPVAEAPAPAPPEALALPFVPADPGLRHEHHLEPFYLAHAVFARPPAPAEGAREIA